MTAVAAWIVLLFGLTIVGFCLWALLDPARFLALIAPFFQRSSMIWIAVGVRLVLGLALLLAAEASALPIVFLVLGWIAIVAAVVLPFIGQARMLAILERFESLPAAALRVWLGFGTAFGIVLAYAAVPALGA